MKLGADTDSDVNGQNGGTFNQPQYAQNEYYEGLPDIDGIPVDEIRAFVGSETIVSKFVGMERSGRKVSWCWPAAVLGFILGPAGSAIWFFRRKMVKQALLLLGIGTILFVGNAALGALTYHPLDPTVIESIIQGYIGGDIDTVQYIKQLFDWVFSGYTVSYVLLSMLGNAMTILTGVICGLFGDSVYKKYTVSRIYRYRMMNVDPRYYQLGLSAVGGTSGGFMALGIIGVWVMFLLAQAVSLILG